MTEMIAEVVDVPVKRSHHRKPGRPPHRKKGATVRLCMCCGQKFGSDHKFNRICKPCKDRTSSSMG